MKKESLNEVMAKMLVTPEVERKQYVRDWFHSLSESEKEEVRAEMRRIINDLIEAFEPIKQSFVVAVNNSVNAMNNFIDNNPAIKQHIEARRIHN